MPSPQREAFSCYVRRYLTVNRLFNEAGEPSIRRLNAKILDSLFDEFHEKCLNFEKGQRAKKRAPVKPKEHEKIPPDRHEVESHCREMGYNFSIDSFFGHYTSNGWKVGLNPVVSWKGCCSTFQAKSGKPKSAPQLNGDARSPSNPHQEPPDWRAFVSVRWGVDEYPHRERWELGTWASISADHRKMIVNEMNKK